MRAAWRLLLGGGLGLLGRGLRLFGRDLCLLRRFGLRRCLLLGRRFLLDHLSDVGPC